MCSLLLLPIVWLVPELNTNTSVPFLSPLILELSIIKLLLLVNPAVTVLGLTLNTSVVALVSTTNISKFWVALPWTSNWVSSAPPSINNCPTIVPPWLVMIVPSSSGTVRVLVVLVVIPLAWNWNSFVLSLSSNILNVLSTNSVWLTVVPPPAWTNGSTPLRSFSSMLVQVPPLAVLCWSVNLIMRNATVLKASGIE